MKNLIRMFAAYAALIPFILFNLSGTTYALIENGQSASYVIGQPDFSTSTGGSAANKMEDVLAVALDPDNHLLFVGDTASFRVHIFQLDSNNLPSANGISASYVLGQRYVGSNTTFNTAPFDQMQIVEPTGIEFVASATGNGRLFVADGNLNRVLVFNDVSPTKLTASAGGGNYLNADAVIGQSSFANSGTALSSTGLSYPNAVAYDSVNDRLFVADTDVNRVLVYSASSAKLSASSTGIAANYVLGQSNFTSGGSGLTSSAFNWPVHLDYIPSSTGTDRLLVPEYGNDRVMVFNDVSPTRFSNSNSGFNATYVLGQNYFTSDTTGTSSTKFANNGVAAAKYGVALGEEKVFVADGLNSRVMVFDGAIGDISNGVAATNVVGQTDFASALTTVNDLHPKWVWDVEYDSDNDNLYAVDNGNHRIMIYNFTTPVPEFSAMMFFVVVLVLGFAIVQKNGGLKELKA